MKISEEDVSSFMALYEKEFHEKLTRSEGYRQALNLLILVEMTYKPMTRAEHRKYYGALKKS